MKVLVIGSGGRALVWKLGQSPKFAKLNCAPLLLQFNSTNEDVFPC